MSQIPHLQQLMLYLQAGLGNGEYDDNDDDYDENDDDLIDELDDGVNL